MDFTNLVRLPRIVEDALSGRGLTGIDVGHDADIAIVLKRGRTRHSFRRRLAYAAPIFDEKWTSKKTAGPVASPLRETGIHPLPPGAFAAGARMGTQARRLQRTADSVTDVKLAALFVGSFERL